MAASALNLKKWAKKQWENGNNQSIFVIFKSEKQYNASQSYI
jgi:hypothetical protein